MTEPTALQIPFGEWRPDLSDLHNQSAKAINVIATADGYRGLPQPVLVGPTNLELGSERVNSVVAVRSPSGASFTFAGTATDLWQARRDGWYKVTRAGGAYASAGPWNFARWGDNLYAVNGRDVMQKIILGSDLLFYDVPGMPNFLGARYIAVIQNQVVLANCVEDQGATPLPYLVRWSGINAPESFAPSAATQAGFQPVANIGDITGLTGGEYAMILGTESWRRMDVVGPPLKMSFSPIEDDIGCDAPGSVLRYGARVLWYGNKGWRVSTGGPSAPVGVNRVDEFTRSRLGPSGQGTMQSAILADDGVLLFSYRSVDAPGARNDEVLCYAPDAGEGGRWTLGKMEVDAIGRAVSSAYLIDDAALREQSPDDPAWRDRSVDDPAFAGGSPFPAAVIGTSLYALQRAGVEAIVETGEVELAPGMRAQVLRLRPLVSSLGGSVTARIGTRESLERPVAYTSVLNREPSGSIAARRGGRFHRVELTVSGLFDRVLGVELGFATAGLR